MKIILALLLASLGVLTGCDSVPANRSVTMQHIDTADLRSASYNDFVKRRTLELEHLGGPYKNGGTADQQANEEAKTRFGEPPANETILWGWGKKANRVKEQAALNDELQKMQRRKAD